ncbi:MAG: protein-disulfide reductase DsbD domain-containing protein [Pseudomonadota bacterium]
MTDEDGLVTAKFFHDTYKKRDSAETLIDAALGRITVDESTPSVRGGGESISITCSVQGGTGSLRQGVMRKLLVHFQLDEGLHIYGEPVPSGMVATQVSVAGPPGLIVQESELPPTETLHLSAMNVDLNVWSDEVTIAIPFYPSSELVSETRPLDVDSADLEVTVRYQACTDTECLLPTTETFTLTLPLDVVDMPNLPMHLGHGQRYGNYDSMPAMRRLIRRKFIKNPLGFLKFLWKTHRLDRQAKRRRGPNA